MSSSPLSRRSFVHLLPLAALSAPSSLAAFTGSSSLTALMDSSGEVLVGPRRQEVDRHGFAGPFSEEEEAAVAASPMAQAIARLGGKGYSCSEMMLAAALEVLELPEEYLDAAAVFGGGIARGDLCGFLTGGLMAIGFAAAQQSQDRTVIHRNSRKASNAYWDWWISVGDVHCPGPLESHPNDEMFRRMAQRTAVKLEEAIAGMGVA